MVESQKSNPPSWNMRLRSWSALLALGFPMLVAFPFGQSFTIQDLLIFYPINVAIVGLPQFLWWWGAPTIRQRIVGLILLDGWFFASGWLWPSADASWILVYLPLTGSAVCLAIFVGTVIARARADKPLLPADEHDR